MASAKQAAAVEQAVNPKNEALDIANFNFGAYVEKGQKSLLEGIDIREVIRVHELSRRRTKANQLAIDQVIIGIANKAGIAVEVVPVTKTVKNEDGTKTETPAKNADGSPKLVKKIRGAGFPRQYTKHILAYFEEVKVDKDHADHAALVAYAQKLMTDAKAAKLAAPPTK